MAHSGQALDCESTDAEIISIPPAGDALVEPLVRRLVRLGLELHDGPLQSLAALVSDVALLGEQLETSLAEHPHGDALRGRVDDVEARVRAVDRELREIGGSLRPSVVVGEALDAALRTEVRDVADNAGLDIHLTVDGPIDDLGGTCRETIFHVVREALRNAAKHSGAREARVAVAANGTTVQARIEDGGAGFDVVHEWSRAVDAGRLGLTGMEEAVRMAGGRLDVDSAPGRGTVVVAVVPAGRSRPPDATAA
jgi:signal transduction histidine kinase